MYWFFMFVCYLIGVGVLMLSLWERTTKIKWHHRPVESTLGKATVLFVAVNAVVLSMILHPILRIVGLKGTMITEADGTWSIVLDRSSFKRR
jgi:hypothetical protein